MSGLRSRLWLALGPALLISACASSQAPKQAPAIPAARKDAVGKLLNAVQQPSTPEGTRAAIQALREAVAIDDQLWEARYNLGILLAQNGEYVEAQAELEKAQELAPNAEDVALALGEVLRRRGEPRQAARVLERFVKAYPDALSAERALVVVLRESSQSEAALGHARAILLKHPGDPAALAELALTHLDQKQVDVADLLVHEALKSEPRAAEAERAAGLVALERGEDAVAFVHFAKATQLDPSDSAAGLNTATVLLKAGIYAKAAEHFKAVLAVEPDSGAAKLGLAAALRGLGGADVSKFAAAEALLKEVLASAPSHWAAAYNLAVLYSEYMSRPEDARTEYVKFLATAPREHPARTAAEKWLTDHPEAAPRAK